MLASSVESRCYSVSGRQLNADPLVSRADVITRSAAFLSTAFVLACASASETGSLPALHCPDSAQLPPQVEPPCSETIAFDRYVLDLSKLVISAVPTRMEPGSWRIDSRTRTIPLHRNGSAAFQLTFSEGPKVDLVCYGPLREDFSEEDAQRV